MILAQIGLAALVGSPLVAQELTARPTEPVLAAPLTEATDAPQIQPLDTQFAAGPSDDPLHQLIAAASTLSLEDADALLHEAYDVYPTPTTRSRAFGAAATAASAAGRHELALAWMDWAVAEGGRSPEREALLADLLAEGIAVALAAGNPVLARDYARQAAAHASGGRDDAGARVVVFERLRLACPDVIGNAYVRTHAESIQSGVGLLATASAQCAYVPILGEASEGFRLHAVRSLIDLETRTREVVEQGLDGREVEARRLLLRRLSRMTTVVEPLFLDNGAQALIGYARQDRLGVDDVAAFAYATAVRDGVFYAAAAEGRDWSWPPEDLGRRARVGLEGLFAAGRSIDE